jgi:hypothetical protein
LSPYDFDLLISALYFFVGLLIGSIAQSRPWIYAVVPALVVRGVEALLLAVYSNGFFDPWSYVPLVMFSALLFSLLGAAVGASLRKARRQA